MHYSVMVIGESVEEQLEPFAEDLEVAEYEVDVVSEREKEDCLKFYEEIYGEKFESFEECYKKNGKDWNYNSWRKDEEGVWREYSTRNPDAHWDWYQIGGRCAGKIVVKEGVDFIQPDFSWGWSEESKREALAERRTDSALLKDIENVNELHAYAIVMDGKWIDNGYEDLADDFIDKLLSELDPETRITFVDCHM